MIKKKPASKAQPPKSQDALSTFVKGLLTIQNQAAPLIDKQKPGPHSSINPWTGNSLY